MNHVRWLSAITLGLLASGCVSYEPLPLRPADELAQLRARSAAVLVRRAELSDRPAAVSPGVFDPRDGLDEAEVVAVALACNPDLAAERRRMGEAQSALITAGLWPNPEVSVTWLAAIGGGTGHSVDAGALFELLKSGERSARAAAARARIAEVNAEVVAAEFDLVGKVREQWLDVLAAELNAELLREELKLREQTASLVNKQREAGEATRLDVSLVDLETAVARRDLRQAEAEVQAHRVALNRVAGLPSETTLQFSDSGKPLTITVFSDLADEDLEGRLLKGRFELRAKEAAYLHAEEELRLAVLQQYPRVSLGPAFEHEVEGGNALGLGISVELPIFDRNQGGIAEKTAARERTRAEYVALLHRLRSDAFAARSLVRTAKAEVEAQEKDILPLIEQNQDLYARAYQARELNVILWMTVQQRAVVARREYLDALVKYRRAVIHLETAMGQPLSGIAVFATEPN